jgi:hypothetical protein
MNNSPFLRQLLVATLGAASLIGCGVQPEPDAGEPTVRTSSALVAERTAHQTGIANTAIVEVTGQKSQALLGSSKLQVRPSTYSLLGEATRDTHGKPTAYVPVFAAIEESEAKANLASAASAFFGSKVEPDNAREQRLTFGLPVENGVAWAPKRNTAIHMARHDGVRGITQVQDRNDAVNRALQQVAAVGLVQLAALESLDLVGVSSTHYAGWSEDPATGETKPMMFVEGDGEPVTSYKSEYSVSFGRRYRGIPIEGATMKVTLDATGRMVRFSRDWRSIVGERPEPVALLDEADLAARRDPDVAGLELRAMRCGFLESSTITYKQDSPGVACVYEYDDPEGRGTLANTRYERINLTDDASLPLEGQRLSGNP